MPQPRPLTASCPLTTELQTAFSLTLPSGELDAHHLILLAVMIVAGLVGGAANRLLSEREEGEAPVQEGRFGKPLRSDGKLPKDAIRHALFGVVAALTVPLWLGMLSSSLLDATRSRPQELFVFGGLCLIYVISTRQFFINRQAPLRRQIDTLQRELTALREQQSTLAASSQAAADAAAQVAQALETACAATGSLSRPVEPDPQQVMTFQDIEVLRALAAGQYICGNLAALCEATGLPRELVSQRLATLKQLGVIENRISDKHVLHWALSASGRTVLEEILSPAGEAPAA